MMFRLSFRSFRLVAALALAGCALVRAQDLSPEVKDSAAPSVATPAVAEPAPEAASEVAPPPAPPAPPAPAPQWTDRGEVVVINNNVVLHEGERASKVVAIFGNVEVRGRVDGEVVAVMGDVAVDGPVGKVVAVMGAVTLGPKASVGGDLVAIGGRVHNVDGVRIGGNQVKIAPFMPRVGPLLGWLGDAVSNVRLLSPGISWPWYVFGTGVLFSLFLAAAFGRGVNACAQSLEERPGATLTTALALLPLLPLFTLLLICTGIGVLLLPFLAVAVVFAFAFGKVAVMAFLGRSVVRALGQGRGLERAWLTMLLGAAVLAVLYCVPWVALLVWALTTWVGLGMVVATIMEKRRREKAAAAAVKTAVPADAAGATPEGPASCGAAAAAVAPEPAGAPAGVEPPPVAPVGGATETAIPPRFTEQEPLRHELQARGRGWLGEGAPRADFFLRLGALLVDIVLVAIAGGVSMVFGLLPFPLVFGGYMFAFWLWRGTTIGGIVFNLKVVRLDGRPVDAATAAVRTLMAFISAVTLLGFLWCLWDDEGQTWHDKLAGTVVIRVPKSTPLV